MWVLVCAPLLLSVLVIVRGSRYQVVGPQDQEQAILLKSQYDIKPGEYLRLPIDVPQQYVSVYGKLAPRLLGIRSGDPDGFYGVGDTINIELEFTTEVMVSGTPTLTLSTGCHDETCMVKEVVSFVCNADKGMFSMKIGDEYLMNINANTTDDQFKQLLEELEGINEVTIDYSIEDNREYSGGNRICTNKGKNVTITFENVTYPEFRGNVPDIEFDILNQMTDPRTDRTMGTDVSLSGIVDGYIASISSYVHVQGVQAPDSIATYTSGNGTNIISFHYAVEDSDASLALDVNSLNFDTGFLYCPVTYANISNFVPTPGAGTRYMSVYSSSLSFNSKIVVTSAAPQITSVTSPTVDGLYTEGDKIYIDIVYDLPVMVTVNDMDEFYLLLDTGNFIRRAEYQELLNNTKLRFLYVVDQSDSSDDLDYLTNNALVADGAVINRLSVNNYSLANITLMDPGTAGSLSQNKDFVIDTRSPTIVSISTTESGQLTAGDNIDLLVRYINPIDVVGSPVIWFDNSINSLNAYILTAPANPKYSFYRVAPNNPTQIPITFKFNWALVPGDKIVMLLPGFYSSDSNSSVLANMDINGISATNFTSNWDNDKKELALVVFDDIKANTELRVVIEGQNGLRAPPTGLMASNNELSYNVISSAVPSRFTSGFLFDDVSSIGFADASVVVSPMTHNVSVGLTFAFSVPEHLVYGDSIMLYLTGFKVISIIGTKVDDFNVEWDADTDVLTLSYAPDSTSSPAYDYSLLISNAISFMIPSAGIGEDTIKFSANMDYNGDVSLTSVPTFTKVCSLYDSVVKYISKIAGATSQVQFSWTVNPTALAVGDTVTFKLPAYDTTYGTGARVISTRYIYGEYSDHFTVTITNLNVKFTCTKVVPVGSLVDIILEKNVGLIVPTTGVRPTIEFFLVTIVSANCGLTGSIKYYFDDYVAAISSSQVTYTATGSTILGSDVTLEFTWKTNIGLRDGDIIHLYVPGFTRSSRHSPNLTDTANAFSTNATIVFNQALYRIEYKLGMTIPSATQITLEFNNFLAPVSSILSGIFTILIQSSAENYDQALVDGVALTSSCYGFCTQYIEYSTLIKDESLNIGFGISVSATSAASQSFLFNLSGIAPYYDGSSYPLAVKICTDTGKYSTSILSGTTVNPTLSTSYTDDNTVFTIALPTSKASSAEFIVYVTGLTYSSTTNHLPPYVEASYASILSTESVITNTFSLPAIVMDGIFPMAELSFSGSALGDVTDIQFTFATDTLLTTNYFIKLWLPGFTVDTLSILSDDGGDISESLSSWDDSDSCVTLYIGAYYDVSSVVASYSIVLGGFTFPSDQSVSPYTGVGYSVGYPINFESGSYSESSLVQFTAIESFVFINNESPNGVYLAFVNNGQMRNLSDIVISFSTDSSFLNGDTISFVLPSAYFSTNCLTTCSLTSNSATSIFTTGSFDPTTSTGTVTISDEGNIVSEGSDFFRLNVSIDATSKFYIPMDGIPVGEVVEVTATRKFSTGDSIVTAELEVECIGICSIYVTPVNKKSGYADDYTCNVTFGGQEFTKNDTLTIFLPDFSGNSSIVYTTNTIGASADDLQLAWDDNDHSITITPINNVFEPCYYVEFTIPMEFGLMSSIDGIRTNAVFEAEWQYDGSYGDKYITSFSVSPVGDVSYSKLVIEPKIPNHPCNISVELKFRDALLNGDMIHLILPGFSVPNGVEMMYGGSHSLYMVAKNIDDTTYLNIDSSTVTIDHTSSIEIQVLENSIPAGTSILFFIQPAAGIKTPEFGVHDEFIPKVALSAYTSRADVTTVEFSNVTSIGSIVPASLSFNGNYNVTEGFTAFERLELDFFVHCTLKRLESVIISLPNLNGTTNYPLNVYNTSVNGDVVQETIFSAMWDNLLQVVIITVQNDTLNSGTHIQLGLNLSDSHSLVFGNRIVYRNSDYFSYYINSTECPSENTYFDHSEGALVRSSSVTFGSPVVNTTSNITFRFEPLMPLVIGHELQITILGFDSSGVNLGLFNVTDSMSRQWFREVVVSAVTDGLLLTAKVVANVSAGSEVVLLVPAASSSIFIPTTGVNESTAITMELYVNNTDSAVFTGPFEVIQYIGYFLNSEVVIHNQVLNAVSALTVQWQLSGIIEAGEHISVHLPGFLYGTSSSPVSVDVNSDGLSMFSGTWVPSQNRLVFSALMNIDAAYNVNVTVTGFKLPLTGISSGSNDFSIASDCKYAPVDDTVTMISVLPVVEQATIDFIGTLYSEYYLSSSDSHMIQLHPGHPLNDEDIGTLVMIEEAIYTITDIIESDILVFAETYTGQIVTMGSPNIVLMTPPFRPAYYYNGSGSNDLVFRYRVARGDHFNKLSVVNNSNSDLLPTYLTQNYELNGGKLLRQSLNSKIEASRSFPYLYSNDDIQVESSVPYVTNITSTSISGVYSVGDKVDFVVQFNLPVSAGIVNESMLLLHVKPFEYVTVDYASGSGTNSLVFVYTIEPECYDLYDHPTLLVNDTPIYEPLRRIKGFRFNYLRRTADNPMLDISTSYTHNYDLQLPNNISFIGTAPRVVRKYLVANSRGDHFTVGDYVYINIEFSAAVDVVEDTNPYIRVKVGNDSAGKAYVTGDTTNTTVVQFKYMLLSTDNLDDGLYVYCDCQDYFSRSFIRSDVVTGENSRIIRSSESNWIAASLVIASNSSDEARVVDDTFRLDKAIPYVVEVYANNTNAPVMGNILSPGDSVQITVKFSTRVTVIGLVRLILRGQSSRCVANFRYGNNTNEIVFVYNINQASGIGILDCNIAHAFDTTFGSVFRTADVPTIASASSMINMGMINSLGLLSAISIDTSPPQVTNVSVQTNQLNDAPVIALNSITIAIENQDTFLVSIIEDIQRGIDWFCSFTNGDSIDVVKACLQSKLHDLVAIGETNIGDTLNSTYTSLLVQQLNKYPFNSLPTKSMGVSELDGMSLRTKHWWNDYSIQSSVDTIVSFDRRIEYDNLFISMNTGATLNKAFSAPTHKSVQLLVTLSSHSGSNIVNNEYFKLSYGGRNTRCISVTASALGPSSIQSAIEEIKLLKLLVPLVTELYGDETQTLFAIDFEYSPQYPLTVVTPDSLQGVCTMGFTEDRVKIVPNNDITFRYNIRNQPSLVFVAKSTVPAGSHTLQLNKSTEISFSGWGVQENTYVVEHTDQFGRTLSKQNIIDNRGNVERMVHSSLSFSSTIPSTNSSIHIMYCIDGQFLVNDTLLVYLDEFGSVAHNGAITSFSDVEGNVGTWDSSSSTITYHVGAANQSCWVSTISSDVGFELPPTAVYENSKRFKITMKRSIAGQDHIMFYERHFNYVSPVGIVNASVVLDDPRPYFDTTVIIMFELAHELLYSNETMINIKLPQFLKDEFSGFTVDLGGDYAHAFNGTYTNFTSLLTLYPLVSLPVARYEVTVLKSTENKLAVSDYGLTSSDPPHIELVSPLWSVAQTPIDYYPNIVGMRSAHLEFNVENEYENDTSSANYISSLTFNANFSTSVFDRVVATISIPSLSYEYGYYHSPFNSGDYLEWREWEKSFVGSFDFASFNDSIYVHLQNLTGFYLSRDGLPLSGASIELYSKDANGKDSILLPTPIIVSPVPAIVSSSVTFINSSSSLLISDLFSKNTFQTQVSVNLNIPVASGDVFTLRFPGMNFSAYSVNSSNGVVGDCSDEIIVLGDDGHIALTISNSSSASCYQRTGLVWRLLTSFSSTPYLSQYGSNLYQIGWNNSYTDVKVRQFRDYSNVGIMSSHLSFGTPSAGLSSTCTVKIITTCHLMAGDKINIYLTNSVLSFTSSVIKNEVSGEEWKVEYNNSTYKLTLIVPVYLYPSSLEFRFAIDNQILLPTAGYSGGIMSGEVTISIEREIETALQSVYYLQPVGSLLNYTAEVTLSPRTTHFVNSSSTFQNPLYERSFSLSLILSLNGLLEVGDKIALRIPAMIGLKDGMPLSVAINSGKIIGQVNLDNGEIILEILAHVTSYDVAIVISANDDLRIDISRCDQDKCPIYMSIDSIRVPLHEALMYASSIYSFSYTKIRIHTANAAPTPFPSGTPTGQPTNQPSMQPTNQPSGQPTRQPTGQPSRIPTGQPTSQPSIPTGQPTSQPSRQPTRQPTGQPSRQPTGQPTGQPSR